VTAQEEQACAGAHVYFMDAGDDLCALSACSSSKNQVWLGILRERGEKGRRMLLNQAVARFLARELNYYARTGKLKGEG
jgi:hypothetical protein